MKTGTALKRLLVITLLSTFTLTLSYGQAALIVLILGDKVATENFHLSIDAGLNLANLPGLASGKMNVGANFGLGTHIKLGEKWHLKPEFKPLSQKGARKVVQIADSPSEVIVSSTEIKLNYIDVPVLLQYNITPRLFVSGGPQISFLTAASQITEGTLNDRDVTLNLDTRSFFNDIDFSIPVEAGYLISISTKKSTSKVEVNIFARYCFGVTDIFKDPTTGTSANSLLQLGLSFPFIKTPEELSKPDKE